MRKALDSGSLAWRLAIAVSLDAAGAGTRAAPGPAAATLFRYTLDLATGLGLSMGFTEGPIYSSAVPVDGLVLAGSDDHHLYAFKTHPAANLADSAPIELLRPAPGRCRTDTGDVYTLSLHRNRIGLAYCTYPQALVVVRADGSFACPMLWGTAGRLRREPGREVSALVLSTFGRERVAKRCPETPAPGGAAED